MTAAEAIKRKMQERGLVQADLVRMGVGSRSRVSELVSGKRGASKTQALLLARKLRIPLKILIEASR